MISLIKVVIGLIILVAAVIASIKIEEDKREKKYSFKKSAAITGGIIFLIYIILVPAIGIIVAGERGVVLRLGAVTGRIIDPGPYAVIPLLESVKKMDVQINAYETEATAASKDLQDVSTKVTLNFSLDESMVTYVYQNLRYEYIVRIIKPAIQEAVKASTALFNAEELITKREMVKEQIEKTLKVRVNIHGIIVTALSITDFSFSSSFSQTIEAKVAAQQLALKAENDLQRVKMEAQQQIEQAKAQAEALRLQRQVVTAELIELRRIETQMKALEKWDGKLPQYISQGAPVPIMDIFGK